jgi:cytochrome c oxidase subunit 3
MTAHAMENGFLSQAQVQRRVRQWGLWLFFLSEAFLFAAVASSRFFLAGLERGEVDQALGLAITSVLLTSSVTAYRAEVAAARGDRGGMLRNLAATILLGLAFLGGVGIEWSSAHFKPSDPFGTAFFTMTGIHSSHVASGVFILGLVLFHGLRGRFVPPPCPCNRWTPWRPCPHRPPRPSPDDVWPVEASVKYWHFVDVVWVFFYPILYLMSWPT